MDQKSAFITGSSSGLGLEICQYLLDEKYMVYGASRRETPLNHENFIDFQMDVSDEDSVVHVFDQLEEEVEGFDLIINNAAIFSLSPLVEQTSAEFEELLKVNVLGPFHLLKYCYPFLIPNKTHLINLSSIGGSKGFPEASAYCASKFALEGMIQSVRQEWKELGIRFTTLRPGAIDTPLWEGVGDEFIRATMLDPEDFLHVFEMVINSPVNMQFPHISFLHKAGNID